MNTSKEVISITVLILVLQVFNIAYASSERVSKANEIQNNKTIKAQSNLPEMKAKVKKKRGRQSVKNIMPKKATLFIDQSSNDMPMVKNLSSQPKLTMNLQQPKQQSRAVVDTHRTTANHESYLHLVLDVTKSGEVQVLSAIEVPGKVNTSDEALGDFVYKVNIDNKAVLLQSVSDPFEMRAFPMPGDGDSDVEGHHFSSTQAAQIIIKVPNIGGIKNKLNSIKMDIFKLKPGYEIQRLDLNIFNQLMREDRLQPILKLPAVKLAPQIQNMLKKVN